MSKNRKQITLNLDSTEISGLNSKIKIFKTDILSFKLYLGRFQLLYLNY